MSFSQTDEESIINRYFDGKSDGFYVDIGAGDAVEFSNTYALYLQGWHGILVEPYPRYKKDILEKRPKDKLCAKVITDRVGEAEMWDTAMLGTIIGDDYKEHPLRKDGIMRTPYSVPCYTMKEFLEEYPEAKEPDFCSIDIETGEEALLKCTDFTVFKPKLICIEYRVRLVDYRGNWNKFLAPFYDEKESLGHNAFYLRKQ